MKKNIWANCHIKLNNDIHMFQNWLYYYHLEKFLNLFVHVHPTHSLASQKWRQ